MKKTLAALLLLASTYTLAEGTQAWTQDSYEEFSRGTSKNVAIRSTGTLELAPAFTQIYNSPATFLWTIAAGSDGAVYIGSGSPARVYRIERDWTAKVIFEPKELQVQSIVTVGNAIYVATSPDGKIYKLTPDNAAVATPKNKNEKEMKAEPTSTGYAAVTYFEPNTKYIWQLLAGDDGTLYAATGDRGEIYRINAEGKGSVLFKSDEAHIRSLAFDKDKQLIAGTDGSGLIYRIASSGEAFVLYSAGKKEITALAVANDGTIYAAGIGEKRGPVLAPPAPAPAPPATGGSPAPGPAPFSQSGGSEVYAIAPDGAPTKLWATKDDLVYALGFDPRNRLLVGTGNKGRIIALDPNGDYTDLAKASANQVVAFASAGAQGTYAATSNLGKVFLLSSQPSADGSLESEVLDARNFSKWGRAEVRGNGNYELAVRSGNVDNPDRNWSPWKTVQLGKDGKLDVPSARFLQWRVTLKPSNGGSRVDSVKLFYHPKNVAPVIDDVAVANGTRVAPGTTSARNNSDTVTINFAQPKEQASSSGIRSEGGLSAQRDRGYTTVRWAAHDDNDDDLLYSVYYKGEGESGWKLLKDKITDKYYSFDSGLMPDGAYTVRVIATDAPSHAPEDALTFAKETPRFEIDNTPPLIESLAAKVEGDQLHVSFSANDQLSTVTRAEYSVDAGEWKFVEPVGQLSDARVETYDFNVAVPGGVAKPATRSRKKGDAMPASDEATNTEHVVVVRVFDRYENSAVAKTVAK